MQAFREYLVKHFGLTGEEWDIIEANSAIRHLRKNDYFIKRGEVSRSTGFILEGVMRFFEADKEGNEPTCYFASEGYYIVDPFTRGTSKPSTINLKTITPCRIVEISYANHRKIEAALPRWNDMVNTMILTVSIEYADVKTMLSLNATERYDHFVQKYPHLVNRVPLQYIASYLGITQPSLSRLRKAVTQKPGPGIAVS